MEHAIHTDMGSKLDTCKMQSEAHDTPIHVNWNMLSLLINFLHLQHRVPSLNFDQK